MHLFLPWVLSNISASILSASDHRRSVFPATPEKGKRTQEDQSDYTLPYCSRAVVSSSYLTQIPDQAKVLSDTFFFSSVIILTRTIFVCGSSENYR
jgi:hypothetical protein